MDARVEMANAIRALAMDAVQQANSGHPGMPMGMAEIAVALWRRHLRHNPANPAWANRDRFVLSNGHGSMLLYSLLHLTGYDLPLEELKAFRQFGSKTPGHPEYGHAPGVETTTGPLGQGIANAPDREQPAGRLREAAPPQRNAEAAQGAQHEQRTPPPAVVRHQRLGDEGNERDPEEAAPDRDGRIAAEIGRAHV